MTEPLPEDWTTGLAVVAHPDDLEYGAASAIARWTDQGKAISYVLVTRGEAGLEVPPDEAGPLREAEEIASASVVGVSTVEFLGHHDGVVEADLGLRRDLARAVRSWGGPSFNMADHRNVGIALLDATRDAANRWIFPELLDEGHEPWAGVRMVCFSGSPVSTHVVDVSDHLERGIESLEQHRAYLEHVGTDAREMLTASAHAAGEAAGFQYAVTFEVVEP
ncbi:PIG-L family deacetylase [soil metagenome]